MSGPHRHPRVLFGSDATYFGKAHYKQYESMITRLRNELPQEEFEKVVRGNALRIFGLDHTGAK